MKGSIPWITIALCLALLSCRPGESGKTETAGIIPNPSFEQTIDAMAGPWQIYRWSGEGDLDQADSGRGGGRCVRIRSKDGGDLSWAAIVPVKPFSKYRFSGWIRTENVVLADGKGAFFNLHNMDNASTDVLTGTRDWTEKTMTFETGSNDAVQINCLFGGWGKASGMAMYDDLSLVLLESRILSPKVAVDPNRTGEPISPYIYGQFIEHLGRCVYGGLWAEMLEDRKFFYPVTDIYAPWGQGEKPVWESGRFPVLVASPWRVVGAPGAVGMDRENPFVGEHTPSIHLPGDGSLAGIEQEGLALERGKIYMGYVALAGDPEAVPVEIWIRTRIDENASPVVLVGELGPEYKTRVFLFKATASCDNAVLQIVSRSRGSFRVGTASLMPDDNEEGFRSDVVALLRELNSPIYRWPGGNFVSGYDWKDGIGERDRRPPRKNPAWTGVEHNDVGIHEYMALMKLIGAEPFVSVNTGLGSVEDVADEVEYCNGSKSTAMGRLRAANGHPEPFEVRWWAVGNEMYGSWQLGHMPLADYAKKHNRIAEAMWKKDPSLILVGCGSVGEWDKTMLLQCADRMTHISEHIYAAERPGVMGHTAWLAEMIRWKADAHRKYRNQIPGLARKDIRIAMDEWNYWYGPEIYGELGVEYFLKDALGVAIGLHEYFRNSDLYVMANYAQTVNVIGAIKTTRTQSAMAATGEVLRMYRKHFETIPMEVTGDPEPLDVSFSWSEDRRQISMAVVNPTKERQTLVLETTRMPSLGKGKQIVLTGSDERSFNAPGKHPAVVVWEKRIGPMENRIGVRPLSVTIMVWDVLSGESRR